MKWRRVNVACLKETQWKGNKGQDCGIKNNLLLMATNSTTHERKMPEME